MYTLMRLLLIVSSLVSLAVPLRATILLPADLPDLTRESRAIARGAVVDVVPRWTDDRRSIETIVTLVPEAYLKGALGESVQFRVPGGRLGRYRKIVVGAPQFSVGDRVVVFLDARAPALPQIVGLSQGVFRLTRSAAGQWQVTPPPAHDVVGAIRRGSSSGPVALPEFERQIRELAGAAR
jgi:hypothetical protein